MLRLLIRSAAIALFRLLARISFLVRLLPPRRLRRLIEAARLPDLAYGGVFPRASYTPWACDAEFQRTYSIVRSHTLVDEYRCFDLWSLSGQLTLLAAGDLIEIGVWRGGTGCLMAQRCQQEKSEAKVFLCDTFTGVVKAGSADSAYVGGEHADTDRAIVLDLAARLRLANVEVLQGVFPDSTGAAIADRRFRLCHIDVDVYESAAQSFAWVWPRLVPGGIVVFDDYGFYSCSGVTRFVNEMRGAADRLVTHNLNGHAVVVKRS